MGVRVGREVPRRVVEDGAAAFLAAQCRDVPERGVYRVALGVVQRQPGRPQLFGLGLRHRGNVEIVEDAAGGKIAMDLRQRKAVWHHRLAESLVCVRDDMGRI